MKKWLFSFKEAKLSMIFYFFSILFLNQWGISSGETWKDELFHSALGKFMPSNPPKDLPIPLFPSLKKNGFFFK